MTSCKFLLLFIEFELLHTMSKRWKRCNLTSLESNFISIKFITCITYLRCRFWFIQIFQAEFYEKLQFCLNYNINYIVVNLNIYKYVHVLNEIEDLDEYIYMYKVKYHAPNITSKIYETILESQELELKKACWPFIKGVF